MFQDPLTDRDLYWIGYLRADGCIARRPKGKTVIFTQVLREPVSEFSKYVGSNETLTPNVGSYKPGSVIWKTSKSAPAIRLDELGVKTELRDDIYQSRHFWRGLLDGDGSIMLTTNQGKTYPYLAWSGSRVDMERCSEFLSGLLQCRGPGLSTIKTIFTTRLVGNKAWFVAKALYENEYSAHPDKRARALSILDWRPERPKRSWQPPT